uniref:Transposase-associated domain-containing protein n=1 Tax=Solanum lycopersicum TaxID=4081 RepID=A0A3Q7H993_SOLLC
MEEVWPLRIFMVVRDFISILDQGIPFMIFDRKSRNLIMDKSWMCYTERSSGVYLKEVESFLQFAFKQSEDGIPCPCKKCTNVLHKSRDGVKEHLINFGIVQGYTQSTSTIFELLDDPAQQLYPGCETFSKLSLIVGLFQIKCLYGLSGKVGYNIQKLFKRAVSLDETLPDSFYGPKKVIPKFVRTLKCYVRNRNQPEGSIVEGEYEQSNKSMNIDDWFFHRIVQMAKKNELATCELYSFARGPLDVWSIVLNGHSTYFTGSAIDEDTSQQDDCNELLHICEDDEDIMN